MRKIAAHRSETSQQAEQRAARRPAMFAPRFLAANVRETVERAVAFLRELIEYGRRRRRALNVFGCRLERCA